MTIEQQLTMESRTKARTFADAPAPVTSMKTIILHVQSDSALDRRLDSALSLARASSAHPSCIHVTSVQAYVVSDSFGGIFVMNDVLKALEEESAKLRSLVEGRLKSEDVSWDYEQATGDVATTIAARASLADLVVAGRTPHKDEFAAPATGLLGDLLFRSRTPIFIAGDEARPVDPAGAALIAWDGSLEAGNAVRSSLGLLKLASNVGVIQVAEQKNERFPGTKLLEYLSRQGIHADLTVAEPPADRSNHDVIAATLVAHARAAGAACMVMGGYSHSRFGEYVFGGVTRALLKECPVPLVIAH